MLYSYYIPLSNNLTSDLTIVFTKSSKEVLGFHPNSFLAFVESPKSSSTSVGRKYLGSILITISLVSALLPTSFTPEPSHVIELPLSFDHPNFQQLIR